MKARKILVTGGTGFIGSALVKRLVDEGHQVRVLDNQSRGNARRLQGYLDRVELIEGDIRDVQLVREACRGMEQVCHLAYVNGTEFFYSRPELVLDVGVKGMVNILDACIQEGIKDFVLASSSEVYQTPSQVPTDESAALLVPDPLNARYSYGGGKIICELMAINYGRKFFNRTVIFRPHNVYGPDMGWEHVIPQFALRMKALEGSENDTRPFPIQGDGMETRSFVYIDDFTDGLMNVIESGKNLEIYHIGTEDELSIRELASEVAHACGQKIEIVAGELQKGGTKRRCPKIQKLKGLGYQPKISLREGLGKTVSWYLKNTHLQPQGKPAMDQPIYFSPEISKTTKGLTHEPRN